MSFVTILRSNIATAVSPLIIVARRSWKTISPSAAATRRWSGIWQEVIRQIPSDDPNMVGKLVFEDPDLADTRMLRSMRAEGIIDAVLYSPYLLGAYEYSNITIYHNFFFLRYVTIVV